MKTKTRQSTIPSPGYSSSTATTFFFERVASGSTVIPGVAGVDECISWSSPTKMSSLTGKPLSNYCSHARSEITEHPSVATSSGLGYSSFGVRCLTPTTYDWVFPGPSNSRLWAYNPLGITNLDSFGESFVNAMNVKKLEAFQSLALDVSRTLPNVAQSILELKDIPKTTIQAVDAILLLIEAMRKKHPGRALQRILRSITLGDLSNAKLWYDYGVMPTIRDWNSVWNPIIRGRFQLSRPVVRNTMELRAPWSLEYYDGRSSIGPVGSVPALYGGTVSGSTLFAGCLKIPGSQNLVSKGLITEASSYINNQLDLWPARATRIEASGVMYGRLTNRRSLPASPIEVFNKGLDQHCSGQAVWEVVKFSFLIDWVISIGEWIRLLERYEASQKIIQTLDEGVWYTSKVELSHFARVPSVNPILPQQGTSATHAALMYELSPHWVPFETVTQFLRSRYEPGLVSPRTFTLSGLHVDTALALLVSSLSRLKM